MEVKFIIRMKFGWSCKCFSFQDLQTNLEFAIRESKQIVSVERIQ